MLLALLEGMRRVALTLASTEALVVVNKERSRGVPAVDLQSVKLTLEYIYGDVKDVGQLRKVALALKSVIQEIEAVGGRRVDARFERLVSLPEGRQLR